MLVVSLQSRVEELQQEKKLMQEQLLAVRARVSELEAQKLQVNRHTYLEGEGRSF